MPSVKRGYITTALVVIGVGTLAYSVLVGQIITGGAIAISALVVAALVSDTDIDGGPSEPAESLRRVEAVSLLPVVLVIGSVAVAGDDISGIFVLTAWPLASGIAFVVVGATTLRRKVSDQLSPDRLTIGFLLIYLSGWVVIFGLDYLLWTLGFESESWVQEVGLGLTVVAMLGLVAHVLFREFIPWNAFSTDEP
ncbi:hypothetical protein [Halorubrum tibetense]|uniref:Uncharacterized protein n=1 Tax=Halorubrum tibetense TaxID=175631 RepID=A0ABD5SAR5_9EURY